MEALVRVVVAAALIVLFPAQAFADGKCKRGDLTWVRIIQKVEPRTYEVQAEGHGHGYNILLVTQRTIPGQGWMCLCTAEGRKLEIEDANGLPISVASLKDVGTPKDKCADVSPK